MKIATGQYKNHLYYKEQGYTVVALTTAYPKDMKVDYVLSLVAPSPSLLFNKNLTAQEKANRYQKQLQTISPNRIKAEIQALGVDKVCLMSWEKLNDKFSPRKTLAAYLLKNLGIKIFELSTKQESDFKVDIKSLDDL